MNLIIKKMPALFIVSIFNIVISINEPDPLLGLSEEECAREAFTYYDNAIHSEVDIATAFEIGQFVYLECLAVNDH